MQSNYLVQKNLSIAFWQSFRMYLSFQWFNFSFPTILHTNIFLGLGISLILETVVELLLSICSKFDLNSKFLKKHHSLKVLKLFVALSGRCLQEKSKKLWAVSLQTAVNLEDAFFVTSKSRHTQQASWEFNFTSLILWRWTKTLKKMINTNLYKKYCTYTVQYL